MTLVRVLVQLGQYYALVGLVFALVFAWRGAPVVNPAAREGSLGFRVLILPGAAALWPLLLRRWIQARAEASP